MDSDLDLQSARRWIGLGLLLGAVIPAIVLLEIASSGVSRPWLLRVYLRIAIGAVCGYIWGVVVRQHD